VPDSIHGIIAARIDLLNAPEREALRRCSVMGRSFWPSAVGVEDDVIAGLVNRALVSEQVSSSFSGRREFSFKHALTHDVAYQTLPRAERRALHRRVADWIREAVPDRQAETTELVAYHYDQALQYGEADDALRQQAFAALLAAGDAVSRRGAYASAARLLDRALDLAPTEDDHAGALLLAARVDVHNGNYPGAVDRLDEVIAAAEHAENAALRADALGWKARADWLRGNWRDALHSAQEATVALEGQPESPELARALARLSQIQMLRGLPSAESTASRAMWWPAGRGRRRQKQTRGRTCSPRGRPPASSRKRHRCRPSSSWLSSRAPPTRLRGPWSTFSGRLR
jgi:tetratricopeptide (TPR) repeat protein